MINASTLKFKLLRNTLLTKRGVILMSKKLLGAVLLSSMVFLVAPFTSLAQETPAVTKTEIALEKAKDFGETAGAVGVGIGDRIKEAWQNQFGVDERIARNKAVIRELRKKNVELRDELTAKYVADAVEMAQAQSCVNTLAVFLDAQVEGQ